MNREGSSKSQDRRLFQEGNHGFVHYVLKDNEHSSVMRTGRATPLAVWKSLVPSVEEYGQSRSE